eukprot:TRINITY_DN15844_c0_g1_i1.p1 TRINITY_DN15844_c0_g1~~TRINITY_DN15844_c0_g1_i1.p1  ORF type:complete len:1493 (+),score=323.20 TRINITY_DN15844_c0_g1_i1:136-4614(+)
MAVFEPHAGPRQAPKEDVFETEGSKISFLEEIASRLLAEGDHVEHLKARETAMFLRREEGEDIQPVLQQLVADYNHCGVKHFKDDKYQLATMVFKKALTLTDASQGRINFSPESEKPRLKLRAATFNNIGCMEKKRGNYDEALANLETAMRMEESMGGIAPATAMNLCSVLIKVGRNAEALTAAENAVRSIVRLRLSMPRIQPGPTEQNHMLVVAQHNLGVAQEFSDDKSNVRKAYTTFSQALQTALSELGPDHPTTHAVQDSIVRYKTHTIFKRGIDISSLPEDVGSPLQSDNGETPKASTHPPRSQPAPPSTLRPVKRAPRTHAGLPAASSLKQLPKRNSLAGPIAAAAATAPTRQMQPRPPKVPGGVSLANATQRHTERMLLRKNKQIIRNSKEERQRMLARRIFQREKQLKLRREQEQERKRREEMAKLMYERMCAGLKADEMKRYRIAARKIQKVFRGYLGRETVSRWESAAITIQSVVRSHLSRVHQDKRRTQLAFDRAEAIELTRRNKAAAAIQRRARFHFTQKNLFRIKRSKAMRRHCCARTIQNAWRRYRMSIEQDMLRKEQDLRLSDEVRKHLVISSVRKLQRWWISEKERNLKKLEKDDLELKHSSACCIQKRVRGMLARAKVRRKLRGTVDKGREKLIRDSILLLQRFIRCSLSRIHLSRLRQQKQCSTHEALVSKAACQIQRSYRCHKARLVATSLKLQKRKVHEHATTIQYCFRRHLAQRLLCSKRADAKRDPAARIIQAVWYEYLFRKRKQETEAYHQKKKREKVEAERRTKATITIQSWARGNEGRKQAGVAREQLNKKHLAAAVIQRRMRCYLAKRELLTLRRLDKIVRIEEETSRTENKAALKIQTTARRYLARLELRNRFSRDVSSRVLQRFFKVVVAIAKKENLQQIRQEKKEHRAAVKIQKAVRNMLCKAELKRLEEYYGKIHLEKTRQQRRQEASIQIQSLWRGYVGRIIAADKWDTYATRSAAALLIQRNFRMVRFRKDIEKELSTRSQLVKDKKAATVKIQTFWRCILAQEYAQMLREEKAIFTDASIHIQCWWRQRCAMDEACKKRAIKDAAYVKATLEAAAFERCLLLLQAAARSILDQQLRNHLILKSLEREIEEHQRYGLSVQSGAAIAIQAAYRGYSDRLYVKGLRYELRVQQEKEALIRQQRNEAALTIQLAVRIYFAVKKTNALRKQKLDKRQQEIFEYETTEDPSSVVQQLFWEMEAKAGRAVIRETEARKNRHIKAAVVIQCWVRKQQATERVKQIRISKKSNRAALVIQQAWSQKKSRIQSERALVKEQAAIKIQALQRGCVGRRVVNDMREQHRQQVLLDLKKEEDMDSAVVVIQSFWRLVCAKRHTAKILKKKLDVKAENKKQESACFIQKMYRGHLDRQRVSIMREKKRRADTDELNRKLYPANSTFAHLGGPYVGQKHSAKERDQAALKIQCMARRVQAHSLMLQKQKAHEDRRISMLKAEAAVTIQRAWRNGP